MLQFLREALLHCGYQGNLLEKTDVDEIFCFIQNYTYMAVSKNNGTPKPSIVIGFSIIFTIHFRGFPTIFGNIHIELHIHTIDGSEIR